MRVKCVRELIKNVGLVAVSYAVYVVVFIISVFSDSQFNPKCRPISTCVFVVLLSLFCLVTFYFLMKFC